MKNTLLLCLLASGGLLAQESLNMSLLGAWHDPSIPVKFGYQYSDVWGYSAAGREYALLGSSSFIHVLDVSDPETITEIVRLNTFTESATRWRDIKVYQDYAYCVADIDANEGLQIIDLSELPASASIVYQNDTDFARCHNIFIDTTASPVRLYVFANAKGAQTNDLIVYSLADPAAPSLLASVDLSPSGTRYLHDGYVRNDTLYANTGNPGMYIYDLRDLTQPQEIGLLAAYEGAGYNHSVYATESGDHMILCDEVPAGTPVKVVTVDRSDPFGVNAEVLTSFTAPSDDPTGAAPTAHNPYVMGDSIVVLSYYEGGIQVWNIANPKAPRLVAFYDTTPGSDSEYNGVWGAYPYLPSGNILGSDRNQGLYVVEVVDFAALPVTYTSWEAVANGKNAFLRWATTTETDNAGWTIEHATDGITFAPLGFVPAGNGEYAYTHLNPGAGTHYYRLRQRDYDGTKSLSDIRQLRFGAADTGSLLPYPNPAPASALISLVGLASTAQWVLYDLTGRPVRSGRGNRLAAAPAAGVYFLRAGEKTAKLVIR